MTVQQWRACVKLMRCVPPERRYNTICISQWADTNMFFLLEDFERHKTLLEDSAVFPTLMRNPAYSSITRLKYDIIGYPGCIFGLSLLPSSHIRSLVVRNASSHLQRELTSALANAISLESVRVRHLDIAERQKRGDHVATLGLAISRLPRSSLTHLTFVCCQNLSDFVIPLTDRRATHGLTDIRCFIDSNEPLSTPDSVWGLLLIPSLQSLVIEGPDNGVILSDQHMAALKACVSERMWRGMPPLTELVVVQSRQLVQRLREIRKFMEDNSPTTSFDLLV